MHSPFQHPAIQSATVSQGKPPEVLLSSNMDAVFGHARYPFLEEAAELVNN